MDNQREGGSGVGSNSGVNPPLQPTENPAQGYATQNGSTLGSASQSLAGNNFPNMDGDANLNANMNSNPNLNPNPSLSQSQAQSLPKKPKRGLVIGLAVGTVVLTTMAIVALFVFNSEKNSDNGVVGDVGNMNEPVDIDHIQIEKMTPRETFLAARDLHRVYSDDGLNIFKDCESVLTYVDATEFDVDTYTGYVNSCRDLLQKAEDATIKLGKSSAIQENEDLKNAYDAYIEAYKKGMEEMSTMRGMFDDFIAYHKFNESKIFDCGLGTHDCDEAYSDANLERIANILIETGDEDLVNYGKRWLDAAKHYAETLRVLESTSDDDPNIEELRDESADAFKIMRHDFSGENEPNLREKANVQIGVFDHPFEEADDRCRDLMKAVARYYEQHYEEGSGDCDERYSRGPVCWQQ